jgi:hypothetical protein
MFHPVNGRIFAPSDFPSPSPAGGNAAPVKNNEAGGVEGAQGAKQPMIQLAAGGGSGCMGCLGGKNGLIPQDKLEDLKAKMFDKIMAHEQAHASAAGAFGGAIHIDYDSNGIAVGGHVPIMVPGLNKMNPEESLRAFEQIYNAAMAPGDPSSQDMSVAAMAQDLMGRAKVMMDQKGLNLANGGSSAGGPGGKLASAKLASGKSTSGASNGDTGRVASAEPSGQRGQNAQQEPGKRTPRREENPFSLAV